MTTIALNRYNTALSWRWTEPIGHELQQVFVVDDKCASRDNGYIDEGWAARKGNPEAKVLSASARN
jgi:hypothetical protein